MWAIHRKPETDNKAAIERKHHRWHESTKAGMPQNHKNQSNFLTIAYARGLPVGQIGYHQIHIPMWQRVGVSYDPNHVLVK